MQHDPPGGAPSTAPPSRHRRFQEVMDAAAGGSAADYDGYGRFWELPLPQLRRLRLYGVTMFLGDEAADGEPGASPPAAPGTEDASCCHADPAPGTAAGRGPSSGLVRGLRGQFPFDGSQFPPLAVGRGARSPTPTSRSSRSWIDDGCPADDEASPDGTSGIGRPRHRADRSARAPGESRASRASDGPVNAASRAASRAGCGSARTSQFLTADELARFRAALAWMQSLDAYFRDERSFGYWAPHPRQPVPARLGRVPHLAPRVSLLLRAACCRTSTTPSRCRTGIGPRTPTTCGSPSIDIDQLRRATTTASSRCCSAAGSTRPRVERLAPAAPSRGRARRSCAAIGYDRERRADVQLRRALLQGREHPRTAPTRASDAAIIRGAQRHQPAVPLAPLARRQRGPDLRGLSDARRRRRAITRDRRASSRLAAARRTTTSSARSRTSTTSFTTSRAARTRIRPRSPTGRARPVGDMAGLRSDGVRPDLLGPSQQRRPHLGGVAAGSNPTSACPTIPTTCSRRGT